MTIQIDGSQGEGGGQILRTALSLAIITGQAIQIKNIRAKRKTPGLMRQHLTAVNAAAAISGAEVKGAQVGSTELSFNPDKVQGGDYNFNIGTAGSCTLVLQTVLPALLMADQESRLVITGGTHNTMCPPFHFLQRAFIPLLKRMGVQVDLQLNRFGFYPAGGGEITATIKPSTRLMPLHLEGRGERVNAYAESYFAALPAHIAERELAVVKQKLSWSDEQLLLREINRNQGPGNVLLITLEHKQVTEVFTGFAERGVAVEVVAKGAVAKVQKYLTSNAAVDTYLADQLLLPMALAGGGSFTTTEWSLHADTNAEVIKQFLPIKIHHDIEENGTIRVRIV
ncbi:MAG: RNA 3'-terminal phosphate cyclase [Methylococcaceae bacterium]|nr:RNA 3'-terminal phosphate cyclase [Methylococcaceae bacterium]